MSDVQIFLTLCVVWGIAGLLMWWSYRHDRAKERARRHWDSYHRRRAQRRQARKKGNYGR